MSHYTKRLARRAAAAATGTAVLALGVGVAQASAATTLGPLPESAPLVEKLYVPLSVTIACDPYNPLEPFSRAFFGDLAIKQVVRGKQIAHGEIAFLRLTCDGAEHTYLVEVYPSAGTATSPPSALFKKGDAVLTAHVMDVYGGVPAVTAGPQTIRLK